MADLSWQATHICFSLSRLCDILKLRTAGHTVVNVSRTLTSEFISVNQCDVDIVFPCNERLRFVFFVRGMFSEKIFLYFRVSLILLHKNKQKINVKISFIRNLRKRLFSFFFLSIKNMHLHTRKCSRISKVLDTSPK